MDSFESILLVMLCKRLLVVRHLNDFVLDRSGSAKPTDQMTSYFIRKLAILFLVVCTADAII